VHSRGRRIAGRDAEVAKSNRLRLKAEVSAFGILINGGEKGDQLPRFVEKRLHLLFGNAAAVRQKFEPITGLFNLLRAAADFRNEFCLWLRSQPRFYFQGNGLHFECCIQVKSPGHFEQSTSRNGGVLI
jgi:hypothetical protein